MQNLQEPTSHFKEKFLEGIDKCKNHLPADLIVKLCHYFDKTLHLIAKADSPCIVHRYFRPGNIIIEDNRLCGIINFSRNRNWRRLVSHQYNALQTRWEICNSIHPGLDILHCSIEKI